MGAEPCGTSAKMGLGRYPSMTLRPLADAMRQGGQGGALFAASVSACVRSQYFWACFVYLAYTFVSPACVIHPSDMATYIYIIYL